MSESVQAGQNRYTAVQSEKEVIVNTFLLYLKNLHLLLLAASPAAIPFLLTFLFILQHSSYLLQPLYNHNNALAGISSSALYFLLAPLFICALGLIYNEMLGRAGKPLAEIEQAQEAKRPLNRKPAFIAGGLLLASFIFCSVLGYFTFQHILAKSFAIPSVWQCFVKDGKTEYITTKVDSFRFLAPEKCSRTFERHYYEDLE